MSLKYLPIRKIPKMFEKLKLEFTQHITGKLSDFVEYFDKQWIKSKVPPPPVPGLFACTPNPLTIAVRVGTTG